MTAPFKPLTREDVAEVLGISLRTVDNWVNENNLPQPKKVGNRTYWHPTVFYGWLEQRLSASDDSVELGEMKVESRRRRTNFNMATTSEKERLRMRDQAKIDTLLA